PLGSLVPSGEQFTEWVASVREIYDSGDKTAATDISLAGVYGQDYRRFTDGALPAGAFDRAVSDIDTFFQVELGAMQCWKITTEGLKDIRHQVLSMRGSDTLPVFFEVADLLQQWIPEIDTVWIPCASHDLPGRNPVAVASGLVEFFTKNDLEWIRSCAVAVSETASGSIAASRATSTVHASVEHAKCRRGPFQV